MSLPAKGKIVRLMTVMMMVVVLVVLVVVVMVVMTKKMITVMKVMETLAKCHESLLPQDRYWAEQFILVAN